MLHENENDDDDDDDVQVLMNSIVKLISSSGGAQLKLKPVFRVAKTKRQMLYEFNFKPYQKYML